jgi:hypothetical protein
MIIKSFRSSAAALCVSAFTLILTAPITQAGGFGDLMKMLGLGGIDSSGSMSTMSRSSRGADDPVNHDANDDRRGRQPGDDRGRHRGQCR